MKTVEITLNISELDISATYVPEQKQSLEQEGIPAHTEIYYVKFGSEDITDLVEQQIIIDYLEDSIDYLDNKDL